MKRHELIALARKLGVSEQYMNSTTKSLIWAIQEVETIKHQAGEDKAANEPEHGK